MTAQYPDHSFQIVATLWLSGPTRLSTSVQSPAGMTRQEVAEHLRAVADVLESATCEEAAS